MKIWTFWEPRDKMPIYLQLCMQTWKKFLPDAEITLVDYSNMREYIDVDQYDEKLISGAFRLDLVADALRPLMLEKHGGVWLDVDTIILKHSAQKFFAPTQGGGARTRHFSECHRQERCTSPLLKQKNMRA